MPKVLKPGTWDSRSTLPLPGARLTCALPAPLIPASAWNTTDPWVRLPWTSAWDSAPGPSTTDPQLPGSSRLGSRTSKQIPAFDRCLSLCHFFCFFRIYQSNTRFQIYKTTQISHDGSILGKNRSIAAYSLTFYGSDVQGLGVERFKGSGFRGYKTRTQNIVADKLKAETGDLNGEPRTRSIRVRSFIRPKRLEKNN